ncbi:MAG: mevalonate kinase, partial [Candidatus Peribacter sp.]|nr:mevalonate kinase [Candidatus Peribacter sp.]
MSTATVSGKIILTGEYAVLFGYPGIAVPSPLKMAVSFEEDAESG